MWWPFRKKKKDPEMTSRNLTIPLTESDYLDLEWFAQKRKLTVAEFITQTLRGAMPANVSDLRVSMQTQAEINAQMEALAEKADLLADTGQGLPLAPVVEAQPTVLPQLPVVVQQVIQERKETKGGLKQVPHSCYNFIAVTRPGTGSKGTCNSETQRGRPCDWPAGFAHDCQLFIPMRGDRSFAG